MSRPRLVVVLEEAHVLLNKARQKREDQGEPPLQEALRRIRKRGVGIVLVDQVPGEMPHSALANCTNLVAFPQQDAVSLNAVAAAAGLSREQMLRLPLLPPRHAIVRGPRMPRAVVVEVPELQFPARPSLEELRAEMEPILRRLLPVAIENDSSGTAPHLPGEDGGIGRGGGNGPPGRAAKSPEPSPGEDAARSAGGADATGTALPLKALQYLEAVNKEEHAFLPVTELDRRLGIPLAEGNRIRAALVEAGHIELRSIVTGRRGGGIRVLRLLPAGKALLKQLGVRPRPEGGKGGFEAQAWATWICRHLEAAYPGSVARKEGVRLGKAADVAWEHDGKVTAFEIQLNPQWSSQNAVKDLLAGFDEVVLCAKTEEELDRIRGQVEAALDLAHNGEEMKARISFRLLKEFLA